MSSSGKSGENSEIIVGYKYKVGIHMILCHAVPDAIDLIRVGEENVYESEITTNDRIYIEEEDLFGGDDGEGGVEGHISFMFGADDQVPNAYLEDQVGANNNPAYRGVCGAVLETMYVGNNPYIKPWKFRVKRVSTTQNWYPAKKEIGDYGDMNGAHIVRDVLTNTVWGMGYPTSDLDEDSFLDAANALYDEGLGLSLLWNTSTTIEKFVLEVLKHIDGVLYTDPFTGKFILKLIREDYTESELPTLDEGYVISVEEFNWNSTTELYNTVTLKYVDNVTAGGGETQSVTVHNLAMIQYQGGVISADLDYRGISNSDTALMVANRELRDLSSELASATLKCNRMALGVKGDGTSLAIGDVFNFSWNDYNIDSIVMRVVSIDYGNAQNGEVVVKAVQDIHNVGQQSFVDVPGSGWTNPSNHPENCLIDLCMRFHTGKWFRYLANLEQ